MMADTGDAVVNGASPTKRQRVDNDDTTALAVYNNQLVTSQLRSTTTNKPILPAPTLQLTGHQSYVYTARFSADGVFLASAGADKSVFIWSLPNQCRNVSVLRGHTSGIQQLCWHDDTIYTCSADKTVCVWDVQAEQRAKKVNKIHKQCINTVAYNRTHDMILTGGDDSRCVGVDTRSGYKQTMSIDVVYPVLCVDTIDSYVYVAGIDDSIHCYDIRKPATDNKVYSLTGHRDSVTGISISHDGQYLLSTSHDQSIIIHDIRSYVAPGSSRLLRQFAGGVHDKQMNLLRCHWSHDDKRVSCGSADRLTYVFDSTTGSVLYALPGHTGSVPEVDFHPTHNIIASCSLDKTLFVGELAAL